MIAVTRFDGSRLFLNADLIEIVESKPDTHITLVNGHLYLVRERDEEVVDLVVGYHQRIGATPRAPQSATAALRLVDEAQAR